MGGKNEDSSYLFYFLFKKKSHSIGFHVTKRAFYHFTKLCPDTYPSKVNLSGDTSKVMPSNVMRWSSTWGFVVPAWKVRETKDHLMYSAKIATTSRRRCYYAKATLSTVKNRFINRSTKYYFIIIYIKYPSSSQW